MRQLLTQQAAANEHLLIQQATTNNLLAALMQPKNPGGPLVPSPAPSEASDVASSLSSKTAPRQTPRLLSETGPQPELITPPATPGFATQSSTAGTEARMSSLEKGIHDNRQLVDGQAHKQRAANHDETNTELPARSVHSDTASFQTALPPPVRYSSDLEPAALAPEPQPPPAPDAITPESEPPPDHSPWSLHRRAKSNFDASHRRSQHHPTVPGGRALSVDLIAALSPQQEKHSKRCNAGYSRS